MKKYLFIAIVFLLSVLACNFSVTPAVQSPLPTAFLLPTQTPFPVFTEVSTQTLTPLPTPTIVSPTVTPSPTPVPTYVVQKGDSLTSIAAKFGLTVQYLVARNNICNPNMIFDGQVLTLQGDIPEHTVAWPTNTNRQILVVIKQQKIYVYDNNMLLNTFCVSTGLGDSATRTGKFHIISKIKQANMSDHKEVAWVMYFYQKNAFRSADWDVTFGWPSTKGSIDMQPQDARWLYHWADQGTTVIIMNNP